MSNNIDTSLLLKGGLLPDGATADILIRDGIIAEISTRLAAPQDVLVIDVVGRWSRRGWWTAMFIWIRLCSARRGFLTSKAAPLWSA